MRVRRCAVVLIEAREAVSFDLGGLLDGRSGLERRLCWMAMAPQLEEEVELHDCEVGLLRRFSPNVWVDSENFSDVPPLTLERLLKLGLLISEEDCSGMGERDGAVREGHWWPMAFLTHRQSRWRGVDGVQSMRDADLVTAAGLRRRFGPPPAHVAERVDAKERIQLARSTRKAFDETLSNRATCRNFDTRALSQELFARMLQRVFSAQAQVRVSEDTVFLKKTSPSGGGLHPTEAYLIVQNVDGIEPGLYHYHPVDHALEPLPPPKLPLAEFARLALAGQYWFANAPVLVALTPRFARSFWKYRHHAKAYRALILDSGHLSQTLYLSATDLGLGAFVTSAINEIDIEEAFGLDPLEESPLAICGFGWRAERMETAEFDPAGEVWEHGEPG